MEDASVGGIGGRVGSPCDRSRADQSGRLRHHHVVRLVGHGVGRESFDSLPGNWVWVNGAVDMLVRRCSSTAHGVDTAVASRRINTRW